MSGQLINKVEQYIPLELVEKNSIEIAKLIKCPICEGIVWNPIKGKCEDYFCENCFNYSIKNKSYCPKHNKIKIEKSDSKNFDDLFLKIRKLIRIHCKNIKEGCNEIIFIDDLKEHLNKCEFRKIKCNYCKKYITFKFLEEHKLNCSKFLIRCECGKEIEKINYEKHKKNDCPKAIIHCQLYYLGCEEKFSRNELKEHNEKNNNEHLSIIYNSYINFSKIQNDLNKKIEKIESLINNQFPNKSIIIKNEFYEKKLGEIEKKYNNQINQMNERLQTINHQFNSLQKLINSLILHKEKNSQNEEEEEEEGLINEDDKNYYINKKRKEHNNHNNNINNNINNNNSNNINSKKDKINELSPKEKNKNIQFSPKRDKNKINSNKKNKNKNNKEINFPKISSTDESSSSKLNNHENIIETIDLNENSSEEENYFDKKYLGKYLKVNSSTVICSNNNNYKHQFALGTYNLDNKKSKSYHFEYIISLSGESFSWLAVGLGDKELIYQNNFNFNLGNGNIENGFYGISINGKIWNMNNKNENCKTYTEDKDINKKEKIVISFEFQSEEKKLIFLCNNKFKGTINNVIPKKSKYLTFCIVFFSNGDKVQLKFNQK